MNIVDKLTEQFYDKLRGKPREVLKLTLFLGGLKKHEFFDEVCRRQMDYLGRVQLGTHKTFMGRPIVMVLDMEIAAWGAVDDQ